MGAIVTEAAIPRRRADCTSGATFGAATFGGGDELFRAWDPLPTGIFGRIAPFTPIS
jgi:hypothetical protein